jgi:2-iminobutanoate/2-iminopropanoate deaminase
VKSGAKQVIESSAAPQAVGPYSQAVRWGVLLFTSGQVGMDPTDGALVAGGVRQQTKQALANLDKVLQAGGSHPSKVLKTTVYLTDMSSFGEMNKEYAAFFDAHKPARSTVEVAALPLDALVEIDMIALADKESEA